MTINQQHIELALGTSLPLIAVAGGLLRWKMPRKLKVEQFIGDWKQLQTFCKDKSTWRQAIIDADKLLEKALKRRKFRGRSMGERLVSAQRSFSNNDAVWSAHNLYKKVVARPNTRLQESMVRDALVAYRQALIDIGALPNGQPRKP